MAASPMPPSVPVPARSGALLSMHFAPQTCLDAPWERPQGASRQEVSSRKGDPGCAAALSYLIEDVQGLLDVPHIFPGRVGFL